MLNNHDIQCMSFHPLEVDLRLAASFWGSSCMSGILRELRGWSTPASCPWGAVGLAIVVIGGCCWLGGFICAAILFSAQCRRLISFAARAISVGIQPAGPVVAATDFRGRLAEYHRGS